MCFAACLKRQHGTKVSDLNLLVSVQSLTCFSVPSTSPCFTDPCFIYVTNCDNPVVQDPVKI